MVKRNRSTLLTVYTTYNSLPRRAAMTRHTDCHAGQQQQPGKWWCWRWWWRRWWWCTTYNRRCAVM